MEQELEGLTAGESAQLLDFVARLSPQWLAGFFDGEGCVTFIDRVLPDGRKNILVRVSISQKEVGILAIISLKFPACKIDSFKQPYKGDKPGGHTAHQLYWNGSKVIPFLEYIKDHVIVKKRQVELGLELAYTMLPTRGGGNNRLEEEVWEKRKKIVEELRVLNKR